MKSVKPKGGSGPIGRQRAPRTAMRKLISTARSGRTRRMARTTDPDARLYRKGKGKEAKLCFMGHGLMENRHGLLVDACLTLAPMAMPSGLAALHMIRSRMPDRPGSITLGRRQRAMTRQDVVNELRSMKVTPHVAQNTSGRPFGDRRPHDTAWRLRRQSAYPQAH